MHSLDRTHRLNMRLALIPKSRWMFEVRGFQLMRGLERWEYLAVHELRHGSRYRVEELIRQGLSADHNG